MAPSIGPGDAEYEAAMREAKALFEAAMAKGAMKGRGRPAAKTVSQPVVDDADDVDLSDITGGDDDVDAAAPDAAASAADDTPPPSAPPAPAPKPAPAARKRTRKSGG